MSDPTETRLELENASEDGAILLFVLALLVFVGIGIGPMMNVALAGSKAASAARSTNNAYYAADGGIEYAIQDLRAGSVDCSSPVLSPPLTLAGPTSLNGLSLTITATCSTATSTSTATSMSSILTATITSVAGVGGGRSKATAVVAINVVDPNRSTSVLSWSSALS